MKMMLELSRDELNALQFPVVVEMWHRVMESNRKRKLYHEEFTEKERAVIARYKPIFHNWYLVKGTPDSAVMSPTTYQLLQRACNFFGGI